MGMIQTIVQAWRIPEMRKKMIFTVLMLVVFRIGSNIPVPYINRELLTSMFDANNAGLFGLFDLFSGGSFSNFTIFALSITPYITSSIILQLLTIAIPALEALAKEGEEGRRKIAAYTRYITVALALIQSVGYTFGLFRSVLTTDSTLVKIVIVLVLMAGTAFLMWLGEKIDDKGVGNGISLLIFAGIVLVQEGERKIPVQYAKRVVGRKMYGGQSTNIPIKVNQAGVIPVIFAVSLLQLPATIAYMFPNGGFANFVQKFLSTQGNPGFWIYFVLDMVLIFAFTYFYGSISFNPAEIAENMKNNGGFIPGIRPGKNTAEYIHKVAIRLDLVSAIFLAIVAAIPTLLQHWTALAVGFGGTSLIIAVGVALDTVRAIETQLQMRNYQGFLK